MSATIEAPVTQWQRPSLTRPAPLMGADGEQPGGDLLDAIVITTGRHFYRRMDGIGVVPLALLGP